METDSKVHRVTIVRGQSVILVLRLAVFLIDDSYRHIEDYYYCYYKVHISLLLLHWSVSVIRVDRGLRHGDGEKDWRWGVLEGTICLKLGLIANWVVNNKLLERDRLLRG
jgi:hypothetical protein